MDKIKHECEVCGLVDELTSDEAFELGWDYPPRMGVWGIVSARTCPDCSMTETAWWEIMVKKTPASELSAEHCHTIERIIAEVDPSAN